jgi:hypothetical protein
MTATNVEIDRVLSDSFPASDPPPWVPSHAFGAGLPAPVAVAVARPEVTEAATRQDPTWLRLALRHLRTGALAIGIVLVLPLYILLLPIALGARGLMDVAGWPVAWK